MNEQLEELKDAVEDSFTLTPSDRDKIYSHLVQFVLKSAKIRTPEDTARWERFQKSLRSLADNMSFHINEKGSFDVKSRALEDADTLLFLHRGTAWFNGELDVIALLLQPIT
jgi:hypothetical protein